MTRLRLIVGAASLVFSWSTRAVRADDAKERCATAFEEGQRLQMVGDLQRAIEEFQSCAGNACSVPAQRECSRLLEQAQAGIPTIVFELAFGANLPRRPVVLSVDNGAPAAYEGETLHLNRGRHRFVFECEGCATVTRRIDFADQDSKHKEVVLNPACGKAAATNAEAGSGPRAEPLNCPAAGASAAAVKSSGVARAPLPALQHPMADDAGLRDAVIFASAAALAAAGTIGFVGFGLAARRGERALTECAPYCSGTHIAEVKRSYLLANVSLGTGLLALGGATVWWFGLRPSSPAAGKGQWSVELGLISNLRRTF